jgi:hypothetical protein
MMIQAIQLESAREERLKIESGQFV